MAELRKEQLHFAMEYFKKHKKLPTREEVKKVTQHVATPESLPNKENLPPETSTPQNSVPILEKPSLRGARKRGRAVNNALRKTHAEAPVDSVLEVDFLWDDADSDGEIPSMHSSDSDSDAEIPALHDGSDSDSDSLDEVSRVPGPESDAGPGTGTHFQVTRSGAACPGNAVITFLVDGSQVEVHPSQVNRAVRFLDPVVLREVMRAKNCRCSNKCFTQFPLQTVKLARMDLLRNSTNADTITEYLADLLRRLNPDVIKPEVKVQYKEEALGRATPVCSKWWMAIRGVSFNKMQKVHNVLRSGGRFCAPTIRSARCTASDTTDPDKVTKYQAGYCFWHDFFERFCNRPNADERLFPTNDTLQQMYAMWYKPWHEKMKAQGFPLCEYDTFKKARHDPAFKDVLKRPKHNHCKCPNCLDVELWRKRAFGTQFEIDAYTAAYKSHRQSISAWRTFEKNLKASAVTNAEELTVLEYDATLAHGFPHFGQRPPKGLDISRLWIVPTHISRLGFQQTYVYHLKEVLKKDANLCITLAYHQIRCAKESGPGAHATKLVLVADNAKDNKCDAMLAFAVELVLQGWYSEVHLDFGEVGHNHNGQDAAHHKLNAHVGKLQAMTLGEEQCNYGTVWAAGKAPVAVIQSFAYDWTHRYDIPAYRRITGYMRSKCEKETANAFCARKAQNGDVEIVWKVRAQDPVWLGFDGQPAANQYDNSGSPGFKILTSSPMTDMRLARTSANAVHHSYVTKVLRLLHVKNLHIYITLYAHV